MRVVIVEDEIIIADYIRSILERSGHTCIAIVDNYIEAIKSIKLDPDIFLLDIQLATFKDGLLIAGELKKKGIPYIFITANNQHDLMLEAIDLDPQSYLTKPIKSQDLLAALTLHESKKIKKEQIIQIKEAGNNKISINLDDILYLKAEGSYVKYLMKEKEVIERSSLNEIEPKLNEFFFRIHRSYIINANHISSYNSNVVQIQNTTLPISRSYKSVFQMKVIPKIRS
ncbi:MAG: DNA-binding response regulator [Flavobacteriales bacterium]|nr:DNA-binding response regulator [Flavobacteriales bacterium]MCB9197704.1 DNA-binding response regulator [Flavobacteriales bacterium]